MFEEYIVVFCFVLTYLMQIIVFQLRSNSYLFILVFIKITLCVWWSPNTAGFSIPIVIKFLFFFIFFIYLMIVYLVLFIYLCVLDNLVFGIAVKSMKITVNGYLDSKKLRVCKELRKFQRSSQNCEMAFDKGRFAWCAILSRFSLVLHVTCFYTFNNCKHNNILIRCTTMAKSIIYLKNNIFAMQPHWSVQVMVLWRH